MYVDIETFDSFVLATPLPLACIRPAGRNSEDLTLRPVHHLMVAGSSLLLALAMGSPASANTILPGIYSLLDHGDGKRGADYGLRVDHFDRLFSVELGGASLVLFWDGGDTASITGTVFDPDENETWEVFYEMTSVTPVGTQGFFATAGSGTLTDPAAVVHSFEAKADRSGSVFTFLADGHRIDGDDTTPVARGWLDYDGTNDFLVRAVAIPEPGTGAMMALGLLGLARLGRRREGARRSS